MRLKAFTGTNLADAMQQVRDALGDSATIMLTEQKENGTRVVVSYDPDAPPVPAARPASVAPAPARKRREWLIADPEVAADRSSAPAAGEHSPDSPDPGPTLAEILDYHGLPESVLPPRQRVRINAGG